MLQNSIFKTVIALLSATTLMAVAPQKGDMIESNLDLNCRSWENFLRSTKNITSTVFKGTRGTVEKVKPLGHGDFGVCLNVTYSPKKKSNSPSKCVWVYQNPNQNNPYLKIVNFQSSSEEQKKLWLSGGAISTAPSGSQQPTTGAATEVARDTIGSVTDPTVTTAAVAPPSAPSTAITVRPAHSEVAGNRPAMSASTALAPPNTGIAGDFESCNANNNYLEAELNGSPLQNLLNPMNPSPTFFRIECITSYMKKPGVAGQYVQCTGDANTTKKTRPCLSENYVGTVAGSLNAAATCLKGYLNNDAQSQNNSMLSVFELMGWESALHPVAKSWTDAGGMGQLTGGAISDVNAGQLSELKTHLSKQSNPICKEIANKALAGNEPMRAEKAFLCDRFGMEGQHMNPLTNTIYTIAYQKLLREQIEEWFFGSNSDVKQIFSSLNTAEKNSLIDQLTIWSHNTGFAGLKTPLNNLIDCHPTLKAAGICTGTMAPIKNSKNFLRQLKMAMSLTPDSANGSIKRREETSQFYDKIDDRKAQIQSAVGGASCLSGS